MSKLMMFPMPDVLLRAFYDKCDYFNKGTLDDIRELMLTNDVYEKHLQEKSSDATHLIKPIGTIETHLLDKPMDKPLDKPLDKPMDKPLATHLIIPDLYKNINKTCFIPNNIDSLFWCVYVLTHSQTVYETNRAIGQNMNNLMLSEKRKIFDHFSKDDKCLKNTNHKITKAKINDIKCDLLTRPLMCSTLESFIPVCIYLEKPVYVDLGKNAKIYLHFVADTYVEDDEGLPYDDAALFILHNHCFILCQDYETKVAHIKAMFDTHIKAKHYEQPIGSIGNYKTEELRDLYLKISPNDGEKKMKKQEYYEGLLAHVAKYMDLKKVR